MFNQRGGPGGAPFNGGGLPINFNAATNKGIHNNLAYNPMWVTKHHG